MIEDVVTAIRDGEPVVLPTDTVYGLAADAFDPAAVRRLLDAKGRGRDMPPPVLVGSTATLDALATALPRWARDLVEHYWPGPLTIVVREVAASTWDLQVTAEPPLAGVLLMSIGVQNFAGRFREDGSATIAGIPAVALTDPDSPALEIAILPYDG